jgi:hypothetical protein
VITLPTWRARELVIGVKSASPKRMSAKRRATAVPAAIALNSAASRTHPTRKELPGGSS